MRGDLITQFIPHADPEFIRVMEKLPEPPPDAYERAVKYLPLIYELFMAKREAVAKGDTDKFKRVVDEEAALLRRAELD